MKRCASRRAARFPGAPMPSCRKKMSIATATRSSCVSRPLQATVVTQVAADIRAGEAVLSGGRRIGAPELGVLATLGYAAVPVYRRPRIGIISTGDELVPPSSTPGPGQVRDSNRYALGATLRAQGALPLQLPPVGDTVDALRAAVAEGLATCDGLVLSGGSSVGERDLVPHVVADLGPPGVVVHGLRVKPGKPTLLAAVGPKPVVGLPGNPASSLMILEAVVRPIVLALTGETVRPPLPVEAFARTPLGGREGWTWFVPVRLASVGGGLFAEPLALRSAHTSLLARASGYAIVGETHARIEAGERVAVYRFSAGGAPCGGRVSSRRRAATLAIAVACIAMCSCSSQQAQRAGDRALDAIASQAPRLAADSTLGAQIEARFVGIDPNSALHVALSVHAGAVTMTGKVASAATRTKYIAAAQGVPAVRSLTARLRVDPTLGTASQSLRDFALVAAVRANLAAQAGINGLHLHVAAHDGTVTVSGTAQQCRTAERRCWTPYGTPAACVRLSTAWACARECPSAGADRRSAAAGAAVHRARGTRQARGDYGAVTLRRQRERVRPPAVRAGGDALGGRTDVVVRRSRIGRLA